MGQAPSSSTLVCMPPIPARLLHAAWLRASRARPALVSSPVPAWLQVPGDGRELIATDPTAVKIRAEDGRWGADDGRPIAGRCRSRRTLGMGDVPRCGWVGGWAFPHGAAAVADACAPDASPPAKSRCARRVEAVNISPFISNLPFGKDTSCFDTPDASGSTSQAGWGWHAIEQQLLPAQQVPEVAARLLCCSATPLTPQSAGPQGTVHCLPAPAGQALALVHTACNAGLVSTCASCPPQAANIQEALEVGAGTLLVDEDTSATNFMIRDARMQVGRAASCQSGAQHKHLWRLAFQSWRLSAGVGHKACVGRVDGRFPCRPVLEPCTALIFLFSCRFAPTTLHACLWGARNICGHRGLQARQTPGMDPALGRFSDLLGQWRVRTASRAAALTPCRSWCPETRSRSRRSSAACPRCQLAACRASWSSAAAGSTLTWQVGVLCPPATALPLLTSMLGGCLGAK